MNADVSPIDPAPFDYVNPNYHAVWAARIKRLARIRADREMLEISKRYYKHHIADFISSWGVTLDPRNAGTGRPIIMPFVLFPRQRDFIGWCVQRWMTKDNGVLVKSRDCGASWLAMATSITLAIFWDDISVGFGSAKEDKVDRSGDPDCLFYKGRMFTQYLPPEYRPRWDIKKHSSHMRLTFPHSGSSVTGEAGDNIGRGGRKTIYWVDEFAVVERSKLVEANLIANTDCCIEMSTVQGVENTFAEHALGGKMTRFDFHYRDDPRKVNPLTGELFPDFAKKKADSDPLVWAQEYEANFRASVEGIIIPDEWVQAAIGAAAKLGIAVTGVKRGSYDVADRGKDKNCFAARHGVELTFIESWSGQGSDIYASVERAFRLADTYGLDGFDYDGDGMGAGVRGDARKVNQERRARREKQLRVEMFRGSGAVLDPEMIVHGTDRKNIDFFENQKAQSWWALRHRFNLTWRAVTGLIGPGEYNPSDIISISPKLPELIRTCRELSQPVWTWSKSGKMMVDKTPDDVASPNNGDAVMMAFAYRRPPLKISDATFDTFR